MADLQFTKNLTPTVTVAISGAPDYEGTYGAGTAYTTGDVVSYNGSSYVARQSTTGNTPGDTAYWQTLASKGNDGAAGPAGAGGVVQTVTAGTNLNGGGSATSVTLNLDSAISLTSATLSAASPLIFEGATADAYETTIAVTDPTADRTVTIPDGSGTIAYLDSNITGNAATATSATTATNVTATANNSTDETVYLTFVDGATGSQGVETDTGLNYNPSSGVLTTTSVTGNLTGNVTGNVSGSSGSATGNAATATEATNITATANNSTDETVYLTFVDGATGTQGIETDTGLSYNPSSGVLTTTSVTGNLTGNVTGDVSGSSGSSTGNAATATTATNVTATANNSTDETVYLTFVDGATGSQGIETDTGLSYNPSSGVLTTTSVTGNLTGNVTGNTSGSSGSTTGNAATATALETARTIGGVSFNGTANINLAGVNTAGNQDTSGNASTATEATNVTATANNSTDETVYLTFVDGATGTQGIETDTGLSYNPSSGVLTTTSVTGNLTGNVTGNVSGSSGSTTGNAATATALATARNINGVSFDGTGNITVTAAAGTLSGTELKSTVVTSSLTSVGTLSALTVSGTVTIDSVGITAVQTSAESFADNDTSLMTSAAIDDRINAASGATAGGSNTQVQYNNSGSFAGSSNLTFNGTTLTANAFSGPLTGNVTGNVSGTAATVTGAAQSNITSVGTLTGLSVSSNGFFSSTGACYIQAAGAGSGYTHSSIHLLATEDQRGGGTYSWNGYNDTTWFWGNPYGYEDSFRVCREASTTSLDVSAAHGGTYKLMRVMSDGDMTIEGTLTENSDSRLKREIVDSSLGLNFVNALQPREYRRVDGVRKHYGFIAQEVAAVLPDASDNAIWVNDQENVADIGEEENIVSTQGLRYTHLIAPLVKAVQELSAKVTALEG